jgi:gliding motility-associated-like protein
VTFTDAAGCSGSTIITVNQGNNLSSTINVTDPPCAFINNGIITVTPTSGTGPYEFSLDGINFQLSDSFVSLPPGNYNISIRNSIGCTGSNSATLNTNSAITVSAIITPPLCSGDNSGTITITASGGLAPFEYSIDAGNNYQSSVQFSNLSAGAYTVRTRDNAGCTKDTLLTLADPPVLSISASSSPASCAGGDGTITITTNGGTPGYSYSINNGVNFSPNNIFTVADGNYPAIIVRDNNSCIAQTSVIVDRTDNMVLTLEPSDTVVCAESQVILQPVTNDPGNTNFNWSSPNAPANTIADPNVRNATIRPVDTSIYIVRAQWGICERTDSITFYILEKPVANAGRDSAICFDQRVVSLQGSASNTSGSVNFSWSPAAGVYSPNSASSFAEIDASTLFTLTVTDNYGCNFAVTDQVTMTKQPPVPANAGRDTIAIKGQPHQLAATGGATYLWSPAALLNNPSSDQPLATLQNDTRFTVIVTDAAGCVGSDTVFVKVYEGPAYYVPNAFSPNGDGLNDIFRPVPVGMVNTEFFRVFNRYGEIIFETNKWMQGWDGNYKGRPQPVGTYVWVVKGTDRNGNITEAKGTVVLIR